MTTKAEIDAAVAACVAYEGFEAAFFPVGANAGMSATVIQGADTAKDQAATGRQKAGEIALRAAAVATGHDSQLSAEMCTGITAAVLGAVTKVRGAVKVTV